ncbi:MAG: hypothetical protein ACLU6Y_15825 [Ruminococcus sp.]
MAKAILPGQQLQIAGQDEISQEEQAILDQKANTNYQETCSCCLKVLQVEEAESD